MVKNEVPAVLGMWIDIIFRLICFFAKLLMIDDILMMNRVIANIKMISEND